MPTAQLPRSPLRAGIPSTPILFRLVNSTTPIAFTVSVSILAAKMATATLAPLGGMFEQLYAQKRRLFEDGRQKPTLEGWPVFLDSALAWDGASSFSSEDAYMYTLNRQEILEIEAALAFFKGKLLLAYFINSGDVSIVQISGWMGRRLAPRTSRYRFWGEVSKD